MAEPSDRESATTPSPIRLLIVDDHPVVRDGLRGMFAGDPSFNVVGEAANGRDAVARAEAVRPDVVLMDLRMPEMNGVTAIKAMADRGIQARVLVLTTYDTDTDVLPAIDAGATGYLLKDSPREELFRAVRAAARGTSVLSPTIATRLLGEVRHQTTTETISPARARSPAADRAWRDKSRGRRQPVHQRGHREDPSAPHLRQARRQGPRRGSGRGLRTRTADTGQPGLTRRSGRVGRFASRAGFHRERADSVVRQFIGGRADGPLPVWWRRVLEDAMKMRDS